jgi:hypothetical protein
MSFPLDLVLGYARYATDPVYIGAVLALAAFLLAVLWLRARARRRRQLSAPPRTGSSSPIQRAGAEGAAPVAAVVPAAVVPAASVPAPAAPSVTAAKPATPADLVPPKPVRFKMYVDWPNIAQDWLGWANDDDFEHQARMWKWLPGELARILEDSPELAGAPPGASFQFEGAHVRASAISDSDRHRFADDPDHPFYIQVKRLLTEHIQYLPGYTVVLTDSRVRFKDGDVEMSKGGIVLTEEKEVDTGVSVQMVADAANDLFDVAVLLSDDRDQRPAILTTQGAPFSKAVIHLGSGRGRSLRAIAKGHIVLFDKYSAPPRQGSSRKASPAEVPPTPEAAPAVALVHALAPAPMATTVPLAPALSELPELETGSVHHGRVSNDRYKWGVFVTLDAADELYGTLENGVTPGGRVKREDKIWVEVIGTDRNGLPSFTMLTVDQKTGKKL